jgi:hypothetical protein
VSLVTARAWLLLAWIVVGAAALTVHAVVFWLAIRARNVEWRWRAWAILPPIAPVIAWIDGRRVAPIVWLVLVATYAALRFLSP